MKWVKHHCDESDREFMKAVLEQFSHEGYTVWYQFQELLGIAIDEQLDAFVRARHASIHPMTTIGLKFIADRCKSSPDFVKTFAAFCLRRNRFSIAKISRDGQEITVEAPNLLDDNDEYFRKVLAKSCKDRGLDPAGVLILSGQCPDCVRTKSRHCPPRTDSSREEKKEAEQKDPAAAVPVETLGNRRKKMEPPASPPPSPPPSLAVVAAAPLPPPAADRSSAAERLESPNPTLGLLLLLRLGMDQRAAQSFSETLPLREIAAVAREAGRPGVQDPGAWARKALQLRWKRAHVFSLRESTALLEELEQAYHGLSPPAAAGARGMESAAGKSSEFGKRVGQVLGQAVQGHSNGKAVT